MSFEKDWRTITAETYYETIISLVHRQTARFNLRFMQDNATDYSVCSTTRELQDGGIYFITWPPFSPDLNPIEFVRYKGKIYQSRLSDSDRRNRISPKKLRETL